MKTLLIHNPTAGDRHPSREDLLAALAKAGFNPRYQSRKDKDYEEVLAKDWDLVFVAGGDGTVGKCARALSGREVPMAILPTGTANNIARSLGIDGYVEHLLPRFSFAQRGRLNLGVAKGPWGKRIFVEAVGLGAIAKAISQSGPRPPKPFRINAGRESLQEFVQQAEAERLEIEVDGETFAGEFLLVEILNLNFSGPALQMALAAKPDDDLLEVVFLFESDRGKMLEWLEHHPDKTPPPFAVRKGRKVRIDWRSGYLRIDDQIFMPPKTPSKVKIRLKKHSLPVLLPASREDELSCPIYAQEADATTADT